MFRSRVIHRGVMVFCGLLLAALVMEGLLQLTDHVAYDSIRVDPTTGLLTYYPNSRFEFSSACFDNQVVTNSAGFHGAQVAADLDGRPKFRIVVLGDSLIEALQVPVDKTFAAVLQQQLNAYPQRRYEYEVIPVAFSGNATYQNLLYLDAYGLAYHPDLVIDVVGTGADIVEELQLGIINQHIRDGVVHLDMPPVPAATVRERLIKVSRKSKLIRNIHRVQATIAAQISQWRHGGSVAVADGAQDVSHPVLQGDLGAEELLFAKMADMTRGAHARLMLLSFLTPEQEELGVSLQHLSVQLGISYSDIGTAMASQETDDHLAQVFPCDGHWNEHGHDVAGRIVANILEKSPALNR